MKTLRIFSVIALFAISLSANAQSLRPRSSDISMQKNTSTNVCLYLDNADQCVATGFKLVLPNGFSYSAVGTSLAIAPNHSMEFNDDQFLIYCSTNEAFVNAYDSFLDIMLRAPSVGGNYTLYLNDIQFATTDLKLVTQNDLAINITVIDPDGIESVESDSKGQEDIYSIAGIKRKAMSKGVNIIRSADGKVYKVFNK